MRTSLGDPPTGVLLVEDEAGAASAIKAALPSWNVVHVRTAAAVDEQGRFDHAIISQWLPDMQGVELSRRLRARGFDGPLLLTVSLHDELVAQEALAAGVDDIVVKTDHYGHRVMDALNAAGASRCR